MTRPLTAALALAATLCVAQPALAAEPYVFDSAHSEIEFQWSHFGFSTTRGTFGTFDGTLNFDDAAITESSVDVTIDTASMKTGSTRRDADLRGPQFFDVAQYPTATFESTSVEAASGDRHYRMHGDLTLHGVTKLVTLDVTINRIGEHPISGAKTVGFDAQTTVSRSAFGIGKYVPAVGDDVHIHISAEMARKSDLES